MAAVSARQRRGGAMQALQPEGGGAAAVGGGDAGEGGHARRAHEASNSTAAGDAAAEVPAGTGARQSLTCACVRMSACMHAHHGWYMHSHTRTHTCAMEGSTTPLYMQVPGWCGVFCAQCM